ncbi:MAG: DUF4097 family beta strand repeat-containing protein [Gemmatimonadales bacterium]
MRLIVLASLLAATVASVNSGSAQQIVGREGTSYSLTERIDDGAWIRIASPNGTIRVTQGPGTQVEVRAEKVIRRGDAEDVGFVVRRGSGGLTVCAVYDDEDECDEDGDYHGRNRSSDWWREHQIRIDFTVRIPAGVRVKAGSGNGEVSISGAGPEVIAASGNGRVTVEGAHGPVDASSGNGDIRVTTSAGPVTASSGNGDIDVAMDQLERSASMEFSTGNGSITVAVPEDFGAELQSSTGNGRVSVDLPLKVRGRINHSRVRGTIGDGGGRLVMTSGNGNIEVRRQR